MEVIQKLEKALNPSNDNNDNNESDEETKFLRNRANYIELFDNNKNQLVILFHNKYNALSQGNANARDNLINISRRIKELIIYYTTYKNGGRAITSTQFTAFVKDMFGDDLFTKFYTFSRTPYNDYNTTSAGGRRRSRHAKKTRRNKRHAKKTRRHRKH